MQEKEQYLLSTVDNPYNPWEDFDNWYLWDIHKGYNTCALLARVAQPIDAFGENYKIAEAERAMDEILEADQCAMYIKVKKGLKIHPQKPILEGET